MAGRQLWRGLRQDRTTRRWYRIMAFSCASRLPWRIVSGSAGARRFPPV